MAMRSRRSLAYDPLADTSQLIRSVVFGPNVSRRLGRVLGVNLLPPGEAFCTYRCAYCPLSAFIKLVSSSDEVPGWLPAAEIASALMSSLELLSSFHEVEALVLIGNGEPTLHPELEDVVFGASKIRDERAPRAKLAVFTNSSLLANEEIARALSNADYVVAKLDAVDEGLWGAINRPHPALPGLRAIKEGLRKLRRRLSDGKLAISITLLELQNGITNLGHEHLREMANVLEDIGPDEVHLEVPPPPPASAVRPPPREAVVRAVSELSEVLDGVFLLMGTSSPIPAGLLKSVGLAEPPGGARPRTIVPEAVEAVLLEGPGARTRLRMLEVLSARRMSCNKLAKELGMSWWSTKRQLERLVEAGLVKTVPFGRRVLYAITPLGAAALMAMRSKLDEASIPLRLL